MISALLAMFQDGDGKTSSMRVLSFWVAGAIIGVWAMVSIRLNVLQPISFEQVSLVVGVLGLKVYQKGREDGAQAPPGPAK